MMTAAKTAKKIFFAGSSHTRMFFMYMKELFAGRAVVSRLPYNAGNTAEILATIISWPLADKDIVHVYAGHRDLMPDDDGRPVIGPEQFAVNLERITAILRARCPGIIVFSNIPPVAENFLPTDPQRNKRIMEYNVIIAAVAEDSGIPVHDFHRFVAAISGSEEKYLDGLHLTRRFYKEYAANLAAFLNQLL